MPVTMCVHVMCHYIIVSPPSVAAAAPHNNHRTVRHIRVTTKLTVLLRHISTLDHPMCTLWYPHILEPVTPRCPKKILLESINIAKINKIKSIIFVPIKQPKVACSAGHVGHVVSLSLFVGRLHTTVIHNMIMIK